MTGAAAAEARNGATRVRLLVEFPELAQDLRPTATVEAVGALVAPVERLEPGSWQPPSRPPAELGLLVLDGYLTRTVLIDGSGCGELLGRGDLLYPWSTAEGDPSLPLEVEWNVLEPTRLVHLDDCASAAAARWPSVAGRLAEHAVRRTENLASHLAIVCLPGLELRLYALLWHLADRFGHVQAEGVVIPVRLTHETLARLVGSRRPSVTTSLSRLRKRGLVGTRGEGWWIAGGRPHPLPASARRQPLARS